MKELIGKIVFEALINHDRSILIFSTDKGAVCYETFADGTSITSFTNITGFENLIHGRVINTEFIELEAIKDNRARRIRSVNQFYKFKISTTKGIVDIVFRNSSNGYDSGAIYLVSPLSIDNILKQQPPFELITGDWSAS